MAWFQNLADHAENVLNKIDQEAATLLSETQSKSEESLEKYYYKEYSNAIPKSLSSSNLEVLRKPQSDEIILQSVATIEKFNHDIYAEKNGTGEKSTVSTTSSKSDLGGNSFSAAADIRAYVETISKLEFDNEHLQKQFLNLKHLYSEIRNENVNLKVSIGRANELAQLAENEMEHYKIRAQRILQEKERLINTNTGAELRENPEENIYITYNEELKKELQFQQDRNKELNDKLISFMNEQTALQQQYSVMQHSLNQSNQKLEADLLKEKKCVASLEEELKQKALELLSIKQEVIHQHNELKQKNKETDQLKLNLRQISSNASGELETRIHALTQTLMVKQNDLETVTSERNGLRIQLEKLESEYLNKLTMIQRNQDKVINLSDSNDDMKPQIPQFMRVSPLDAGVTRKVKHAYSSLDALSIRTGVFLRRYPVARVFVFCYMVLLHFWVLVILLNYAPSTHTRK